MDYSRVGESIKGLAKIVIPLAIVGLVSIVLGVGYLIYLIFQHVKLV